MGEGEFEQDKPEEQILTMPFVWANNPNNLKRFYFFISVKK